MYPNRDVIDYYIPRMKAVLAAVLGTMLIAIAVSPFRQLAVNSAGLMRPQSQVAAIAFSNAPDDGEDPQSDSETDELQSVKHGFEIVLPPHVAALNGVWRGIRLFEDDEAVFVAAGSRRDSRTGRDVANDHAFLKENDRDGNPAGIAYWKIDVYDTEPDELSEVLAERFGDNCEAGLGVSDSSRAALVVPIVTRGAYPCRTADSHEALYSEHGEKLLVWESGRAHIELQKGEFDAGDAIRFVSR